MVIFYTIIAPFHNQDTDINKVKIQINYSNTRIPQLSNMETYITMCKRDSQWKFSTDSRNSNWGSLTT